MKVAFLVFLATIASAQDSVRGVVIDSVSRQFLRGAKVTIEKPQTLETSLDTDAAGAFEFDQLKPGPYQVTVVRHGYPDEKTVTVNAAESPAAITIELDPPASVSGRVMDEDGDGLAGCSVELRAVSRPKGAGLVLITQDYTVIPITARGTSSGERGEYRVFDVLPGKYTVAAQCDAPGFQPRPLSAGPDPPPSVAWVPQFYPAATDASSAQQIELAPGAERTAVDFRMRTAWVTQVRATLTTPSEFARDEFMMMNLIPADGQPVQSLRTRAGMPFEFSHVFPGSYELQAFSIELKAQGEHAGVLQHIEVKDHPVSVAMALRQGIDISGNVEVDRGSNRDQIKFDKANVRLTSKYPNFDPVDAGVNADGSFTIKSVIPALWHIGFTSDSVYVKSVWLGTKEVVGGLLDLTLNAAGATDTLRILVSGNTASVRGTAPPEADVAWSALDGPVPSRSIVRTDAKGQFSIGGLGPGRYRLTILPDEEGGSEITLSEGENATVELKAGNAGQ